MERNPSKRLGSGKLGSREIQAHPFFSDVNWEHVVARKLPVPPVQYKLKVNRSVPKNLYNNERCLDPVEDWSFNEDYLEDQSSSLNKTPTANLKIGPASPTVYKQVTMPIVRPTTAGQQQRVSPAHGQTNEAPKKASDFLRSSSATGSEEPKFVVTKGLVQSGSANSMQRSSSNSASKQNAKQ